MAPTMPRMNTTAQQFKPHDDGRGLYPASIRVGVPRELPAQIYAAAEAEGCNVSEFVRRAISARLEAVKVA